MNAPNAALHTMTTPYHPPPAGRQHRPRRKSLEQLEAKYKALMRNMLMYQQMRKRNMGTGSGAGTNVKSEAVATGGRMDEKSQQHMIYQAQQTLPTPESSVSPASSTSNLEDTGMPKHGQIQQQSAHQHHQNPAAVREQQRERPAQKRLQNSNNGPKSAYERRETGTSARHARPAGRPMPAAMQLAYEELASMQQQQQQTPPPQQHHQHQQQQQHQFHHPAQETQMQHQGSAPIPIPRPANIQIPPHYMQQQYAHHVSPHMHGHHQPLASPLPTPPHLNPSYPTHHALPTLSAPYVPYDTSGMQAHLDHQQQQQLHHQHQQQQQQQHHGLPTFETNGNVEGDILDCFVPNMGEM